MEKLKCGFIYVLWLSPAHIHRVYYSLKKSPDIVLKVILHCEACAQVLKWRIRKIQGVESVETNLANSRMMVKGIVEPEKLVDYFRKRTGKQASIVKHE
ncbi:hypothetical protein SLA2020_009170 [Shorea laevis]